MSHKNKPSKYHHVVPRAYQLQWSFNNSESLYAFFRETHFLSGEIRNAGNLLGINDINSINFEAYVFLSEEGINRIFECLNGKTINGVHVNDSPYTALNGLNVPPPDFINNIQSYVIYDENGKLLNKGAKNGLTQQIKTRKLTQIEDCFSQIDNSWIDILEKTRTISLSPGVVCSVEWRDKIERYLLCQYIRNPNMPSEIEELINTVLDLRPIQGILQLIPNGIEKFKTYYRRGKSIEFSEPQPVFKDLPSTIKKYSEIFESMTYTILRAPTDCSFITSDSPITFFTKAQNFSKGVYFPITPKIMLFMVRINGLQNYKKNIYVEDISSCTTKYINDIILQNANKILISNQPSLDNLLQGQYVNEEWKVIANKDKDF
jgi:hypothetical protein